MHKTNNLISTADERVEDRQQVVYHSCFALGKIEEDGKVFRKKVMELFDAQTVSK